MYRATVAAVSGIKVYAGGRWLTCIGNSPVRVGDHIWTDGRCVYGNELESGAPFIPIIPMKEEGIPLFPIYQGRNQKNVGFTLYYPYFEFYDNRVKTIREIRRSQLKTVYAGLINNKNKIELIDSKSYGDDFCGIVDCEMNDKGEIYILESVKNETDYSFIDGYEGVFKTEITGGHILKDGSIVDSYLSILQNEIDKLKSEVAIKGYSDATVNILGGFIDKKGNYQIYCTIYAYSSYMYPDIEEPPYNEGYLNTISTSQERCLFISNSGTKQIIDSGLHYSLKGVEKDYFQIEVADHSIKMPLQDDYYFTFAFPQHMRNITDSGFSGTNIDYDTQYTCHSIVFPRSLEEVLGYDDPYEVKIYDKNDKLILTLDYHFGMPLNIKICNLKGKNFLFFPYAEKGQYYDSYEGGLFVVNASGNIIEVKSQYMGTTDYIKNNAKEYHMKPLNFRLRHLNDIKIWTKTTNKYIKTET